MSGDEDPMDETIKRKWREIEERGRREYDGVEGTLPEWMPEPLQVEFEEVRCRLLERHSADDLRNWLQALRDFLQKQNAELERIAALQADAAGEYWLRALRIEPLAVVAFPIELLHDLRALLYIHGIASLGEARGYAAYLGTGPDKIYRKTVFRERQRTAAARRRYDALQLAIMEILKANRAATTSDVLGAFREDGKPVQERGDDAIYWIDAAGRQQTTSVVSIPNRVTKARQELGISPPRHRRHSVS